METTLTPVRGFRETPCKEWVKGNSMSFIRADIYHKVLEFSRSSSSTLDVIVEVGMSLRGKMMVFASEAEGEG
jgi:hypothetical protein